jgi:tetratricopeptide (TPR) repeat protein
MGDLFGELASLLADEVVFIRLKDDLEIERKQGSINRKFVLPAQLPLPLTRLGAQALKEDNRVFPMPALVQGLLFVLEREEVLGSGLEQLPIYRAFAHTMAEEVVHAAEDELKQAVEKEDWPIVRVRAVFLLNIAESLDAKPAAQLWAALGIASARLGDMKKAEGWLRRAVTNEPAAAEAHAELGTLYGKLGRFEDSKSELEKALELRPTDAALSYNLAQTCLRLGNKAEAMKHAAQAKRADPGNPRIKKLAEELEK